jgi:hypothetical protein
MVGPLASGRQCRRIDHANPFFHARNSANDATASGSGCLACASAAALTAGSAARRNGLVARSSPIVPDRRRQRRHSAIALILLARPPLDQHRIAGLDGERKAEVRDRVFVAAVHARVGRERGELTERRPHLRRRAFEQPAASGGEQRVAAENRGSTSRRLDECDMAHRVARNVEHIERDPDSRHVHAIAFHERYRATRNRFTRAPAPAPASGRAAPRCRRHDRHGGAC